MKRAGGAALAVAACAITVVVALALRDGTPGTAEPGESGDGHVRKARRIAAVPAGKRPAAERRQRQKRRSPKDAARRTRSGAPKAEGVREKPVLTAVDTGEPEFTAAERLKLEAVQSALDGDDLSAVLKAITGFERERDPRLRRKAVEALSWFGKKAVPGLARFLSDGDEDVAGMANDALVHALGDFEESENDLKAEYIRTILSSGEMLDDDAIFMIAGELRCILDDALVVQTAADIIGSTTDSRVGEEMKDVYEFAAGEPYTTPDAAKEMAEQIRAEAAAETAAEAAAETATETATETAGGEPAPGASDGAPAQENNP